MAKKLTSNQVSEIPAELLKQLDFQGCAEQLNSLIESILSEPEINHAKIEFIKEEITAGRYEINNLHIAQRLLEHVKAKELEAL